MAGFANAIGGGGGGAAGGGGGGALPTNGYARTGAYVYLRACERFSMAPWGGPGDWTVGEEALIREYLVVRELEEAK